MTSLMNRLALQGAAAVESARSFSLFWSLLVPAAVLVVSVAATWFLYRHFSRQGQ